MPAAIVKVHEGLWAPAPTSRKEEWRVLCSELASHTGLLPDREATEVVVACDAEHVEVRVLGTRDTEFGPAIARWIVSRLFLGDCLTAYGLTLTALERVPEDGSALGIGALAGAVVGAGATLAWHKLRKRTPSSAPPESNRDMNMDVGQVLHVEEWGGNKACRVSYRGSDWDIEFQGAGEPSAGSYVIRSVVGNKLVVTPLAAG